jgi:hypothetical protein
MATQSPTHTRHLNGEHSTWCKKIKGKLIYCRSPTIRSGRWANGCQLTTNNYIKSVGLRLKSTRPAPE